MASPPFAINVTGEETLSVRRCAEQFGERMGKAVTFTGEEANTALLSNASRSFELFGPATVTVEQMMDWIVGWLKLGGETHNKADALPGERRQVLTTAQGDRVPLTIPSPSRERNTPWTTYPSTFHRDVASSEQPEQHAFPEFWLEPQPLLTATRPREWFSHPIGRMDGNVSSTGFIHAHLKHMKPKLEFDPEMDPKDFPAWREAVRTKLLELMAFPEFDESQPAPKRLWSKQREGYRLEKVGSLSGTSQCRAVSGTGAGRCECQAPAPGVMCFPGSFSSKESMTEELELSGEPCSHRHAAHNRMAWE